MRFVTRPYQKSLVIVATIVIVMSQGRRDARQQPDRQAQPLQYGTLHRLPLFLLLR
jgi:hypothetical protein